jgi:hypothetical protein
MTPRHILAGLGYSAHQKNGLSSRDRNGETRVTVIIAIFLALGLLTSGGYVATRPRTAPVVLRQDDDEIYTGSIFFTPPEGNVCHQLLFNNRTGQLADAGNVDCDQAFPDGVNPKRWSWTRVQAISRGFRDHF